MKVLFLFFCFTLPVQKGFSQRIFFAKANYSDSIVLEKNIPALAQHVIEKYQEADEYKYYDNLFRLQIVAKSYLLAKNSLDSLSGIVGKKVGDTGSLKGFLFQYKMYCAAAIDDSGGQKIIADTYQAKFEKAFNASNDYDQTVIPNYFENDDYPMQNGVFMSYMLRWLHYVMDNKLTDEAGFNNDKKWDSTFGGWYKKGPSFRSLDTLEGRPNYIFQRWLQHPGYDSYWQNMTPQKEEFAKINIPILTTTGYWDDDQLGAMYYYRQYHQWNKNPDYYLIIGPYDHGGSQGYPAKKLEGYIIDSIANIHIADIIFQWFDHVLKGSSLPDILKDKVNFEVMGVNEWRHVSSLDKMHNDSLTLYLGNTSNGKQYTLLKTKPKKPGYIAQTVDMADRSYLRFQDGDIDAFPSIIDSVLNPEKEKLIFVSEPVDKPFAISGALSASIVASINKKDIDIVLDLYEQTPAGKFFALNETLQRASYAKDITKRKLLQPGKIETINLNHTFITSKQLQKGSRIIITIGVNKSPSWQINYGTGKDVSDETIKDAAIPLEIKWYNNSYIKLPILK